MSGLRTALVFCLLSLSQVFGAAPTWPHERSDIAPDPAVHWGVLPNGLRYAIRPNAEPKDRISLRFVVEAGSLHERDDERGLAHFLEHMAFRSTRGHPDGGMVALLQRLGIAFGPDNTAFTTPDYTIYHLELPDTKPETLRESLGVFREYADGILFKESEIDVERGVILSEMSTRNTPDLRSSSANIEFLIPEARQNIRLPIGQESQIRNFTASRFQAFYDAWYRPARMIITMAGAIDPAEGDRLMMQIFGSLAPRGEARPEPPLVRDIPADLENEKVRVFTDPGIVGLGLSLERAVPVPIAPDTREEWARRVHGSLAFNMLQRRLADMATQRGASFLSPQASYAGGIRGWEINAVSFPSKLAVWRLLVSEAEQELRRAHDYGFTAEELRKVKVAFTSYYEQAVRSAATTPSDAIATQIAVSLVYDKVFTSAEIMTSIMQPIVDTTTLDDSNAEFRRAWGEEQPKLFVAAAAEFARIPQRDIATAYTYSQRVEVLPPVEQAITTFAYTDFGTPGKLNASRHEEDLDLQLTQFANGTQFNFKQTDFEADSVLVSLRVGRGRLSMPVDQPGLELLANYGLLSGGVGRHTNTEMTDILNGHVISLNFSVGTESFIFSLRCAPRELVLGLQTLTAILTDSAYRPEAMRAARAGYGSLFESLSTSPGGPIYMTAPRVLAAGDLRFGIPNMDVLATRTLGELRAWLEPEFQHGALEVSVVGAVDFDTATKAIAQTLGALPPRQAVPRVPAVGEIPTPAVPTQPFVSPVAAKLRQSAVAYYWMVPQVVDVHTERRLRLLADIIEDRLRQRVREEFGAAYSITTRFAQSEGFPSQNYMETYAEVEPSRVVEVDQLIRREIAAMRRDGITRDEFERSKLPYLAQRSADLRSNSYWGYTVLHDAQTKPERLAAARDRTADSDAMSLPEIQALIDRWLDPAAIFAFRTFPQQEASLFR